MEDPALLNHAIPVSLIHAALIAERAAHRRVAARAGLALALTLVVLAFGASAAYIGWSRLFPAVRVLFFLWLLGAAGAWLWCCTACGRVSDRSCVGFARHVCGWPEELSLEEEEMEGAQPML
eukprot:TRINITY_DN3283_c0_g1_i2.p1 TRINITY_DN3283_c0_g1~~TRINITY_DN3283_c0_g1_i2.p1  ORF type:complete len:122 (-),score=29.63 TRINITY_DN3283_c0_g1_i2:288-653(-)